VHKDNPIEKLTLAQIDAIFSRDRKRGQSENVEAWGQLGLSGPWQAQPLRLYGRNKGSGTRDFFKHVALLDGEMKEAVMEVPGSASEILAIARDPQGIGYAGTGFDTSSVRALPVAEAEGKSYISPSLSTVLDGSYPLRRHLYLYVDQGDMDPVLEQFLKFVNSREGQQAVVRANLYPLSKDEVERNLALLKGEETKTAAAPADSPTKPD
jgi:phosphate transport system substrate-binding protein